MKKQSTSGTSSKLAAGDRREDERKYFPEPSGKIYLWVNVKKRIDAQVTDVAPGGLAVVVESDWKFEPGFQVRVEFRKEKHTAAVSSVNKLDDQRLRIGLMWVS